MGKIIGLTVNGIEEVCRWNNATPCPRHKIHSRSKTRVKKYDIVLNDDDFNVDPMDVFNVNSNVPERVKYHLEVKGANTGKYVPCNEIELCVDSEHIEERAYRKLQFDLDERVPGKDLKHMIVPPTLVQIAEDFVAYRDYSRQIKSRSYYNRNVVLPEGLTEGIAAYCFGGKLLRGMSGDIMLPDGSIGEVKGSSSSGPNSFSPSEWFDRLIYVKYDLNDTFEVYDLNRTRADIEHIKVKKDQTFKEQADVGRRPRFIIQKEIVDKEGLQPTFRVVFDGRRFVVSP